MAWHDDDWRYGPKKTSKPIEARGGIRAQSKRGDFGETWWAKRWVMSLESFEIGARLARGRSYARKGQVLSVRVIKGWIHAKVQGSRSDPYEIAVQVRTLTPAEWDKVIEALSGQALYVAKLLAGEMPHEIEDVFKTAGVPFFPDRLGDLSTKCSCPDWSNPCKHIAAVLYLLGEEFDRDPFLIFQLRGLSRDELMARLEGLAPADAIEPPEPPPPEPLSSELGRYWGVGQAPEPAEGVILPETAAALPRRLGGFPFWRGETPWLEAIEPLYRAATARGVNLLGENAEN